MTPTIRHTAPTRRWATVAGAFATPLLCAAPAHAQPGVPIGGFVVPRNISYWEMFSHASPIVQGVMVLLLLASVATWTIWLAKLFELRSARQRLGKDIRVLADAGGIEQVGSLAHNAPAQMLQVARAETRRTGNVRTVAAAEGLKDRVAAQLNSTELRAVEHVTKGTAVLATVGAIAPFVGLFGTVWGIMTSFIGISQSHTTNLAVVAPGIAEALLATAMGLVAAIPAVVMYNHVARVITGFRNELSEAATQVACLFSHSVDVQLGRDKTVSVAASAAA